MSTRRPGAFRPRRRTDRPSAGARGAARRRPRLRGALRPLPAPDRRATCSAWSATTAAPRTSRRRSSSPRCGACARPSGRSPSSPGSTRSPRTRASTRSGAAGAPRRSPSTPTSGSSPSDYGRLVGHRARAGRGGRRQAGPRPPVRRVRRAVRDPPPDPRHARARGAELQRDRRAHGHEPPGRREHAVPRAQAAGRGVRRARLRRALPAHPGDHRRRRRDAGWACATSAGSRATSRTASRAGGSPPHAGLDVAAARAARACASKIAALAAAARVPAAAARRRRRRGRRRGERRRSRLGCAPAGVRRAAAVRLGQGRGRPGRAARGRRRGGRDDVARRPASATSAARARGRPPSAPSTAPTPRRARRGARRRAAPAGGAANAGTVRRAGRRRRRARGRVDVARRRTRRAPAAPETASQPGESRGDAPGAGGDQPARRRRRRRGGAGGARSQPGSIPGRASRPAGAARSRRSRRPRTTSTRPCSTPAGTCGDTVQNTLRTSRRCSPSPQNLVPTWATRRTTR